MNLGDKQEVSHLENSAVNQAGRDVIINQGLSATDVINIVKTTVASELAIYSNNAETEAKQRIQKFSDDMVGQLAEKLADKIDRFNEPALQFAVREAALGYVRSGLDEDKDNLIDLMLERVKAEEHSTKQKLIDQAIKIIPSLSSQSLAVLTLLAFRQLTFTGVREEYIKWLKTVDTIVSTVPSLSSLDIDYLTQAGCVIGLPGIAFHKNWEDDCLLKADLFFRHPIPEEAAGAFMTSLGIQRVDGNYTFPTMSNNPKLTMFIITTMITVPELKIGFNVISSSTINTLLKDNAFKLVRQPFEALKNASAPFTKEDVIKYFESLNPNWRQAIDFLNKNQVKSLKLTPVGAYIGSRQLSKLSGRDISIDIFYK